MGLIIAVLSGFVAACGMPIIALWRKGIAGKVIFVLPAILFFYFASLVPSLLNDGGINVFYAWAPALGLNFSFRADGLGLLFAFLISGIGTLVFLYAKGYFHGDDRINRFYGWLLVFMAAMLGVALSDNALLLFIFWELTSLSSFVLIGFNNEQEASRRAALQALLVTSSGGLALLAGLVVLGQAVGSYEISMMVQRSELIRASPYYLLGLGLVLAGALTKSAQFPFHFWLPNAMEAPTPVSAYLHSATMVKAGVYLLARLGPVMGGTPEWTYSLIGFGTVTMLVGGILALWQTDLKRLLAYSTISALGMLTLLIGIGTPLSLKAAAVLLLAHGLYKGALFLVAGIIDHECGTRDVTLLGGLWQKMPMTSLAAGISGLSMAGVIPFFGFVSKEIFYEAALEQGWIVMTTVLMGGLLTVFVAGLAGFKPFWGEKRETAQKAHDPPVSMWVGPAFLSGLSLVLGFMSGLIGDALIRPAVLAMSGISTPIKLALWHGFNPVLAFSLATVVAGVGLYLLNFQVRQFLSGLVWRWGPERLYTESLNAMMSFAQLLTGILQSGYLRYYLFAIVLTTIGLAGSTLVFRGGLHWPDISIGATFYEVILGVLIVVATVTAVRSRSRLGAVAALGIAGYGVALIFLLFGAPDLAMTQFLIESLTVILFVLAFYHLPHFARFTSVRTKILHAAISIAAGGLMTALVLSAVGLNLSPTISNYFAQNAYSLAHGRNVVNVILVDFRGIDTMGEIAVLAIAAVGIHALLKLRKEKQG